MASDIAGDAFEIVLVDDGSTDDTWAIIEALAVSTPQVLGVRLMRRRVVDILLSMPERDRFIRGMVSWIGGRQVALPYARDARFAGTTKYPLRKMIGFALDAITSF